MIGWFQFQHENTTKDSWTLDSVNISLSLAIKISDDENEMSISWIYGVIAGIIIVMTALVVFIVVQCCRRKPKRVNGVHTEASCGMEYQNPTYEDLERTIRKPSGSLQEKNDTMQPMQTFFQ